MRCWLGTSKACLCSCDNLQMDALIGDIISLVVHLLSARCALHFSTSMCYNAIGAVEGFKQNSFSKAHHTQHESSSEIFVEQQLSGDKESM